MYDIVIENGLILTDESDYAPLRGTIGIKDGKIAYIGPDPLPVEPGVQYIDAAHKAVLPGLINGHCHGDMTILRGLLDGLTLQEQNQRMEKSQWLKPFLTDEDRILSRQLTYLEAIKSGTTFLMENMYWDLGLAAADAMADTGLLGALALGVRVRFDIQGQYLPMDYLHSFGEHARERGLVPVLGTVAEEHFDPRCLQDITHIAQQLGWLTTQHLAETTWRQEAVQQRFGETSIRYLAKNGFLHNKLIGSHVVYADEEEVAFLRSAGVKVVNTPLCEAKIADGLAPIPAYLKAGIPVGLGTDGGVWNNSNDIFREMKGICLLHSLHSGVRSVTHRDALRMATLDGARVFDLQDVTGSIRAGKRADIITVDLNKPHFQPIRTGAYENISSSMVYNATGSDVSDSIIGGKLVMRDRQVLTVDEGLLLSRVQRASDRIMDAWTASLS